MMKIPESLSRITPLGQPDAVQPQKQAGKPEGASFADAMKELFSSVNERSQTADKKIIDVVTGASDDLHNAMIALEEANVSFQLMLEIRNKMLEAYQEINRMNI